MEEIRCHWCGGDTFNGRIWCGPECALLYQSHFEAVKAYDEAASRGEETTYSKQEMPNVPEA